MARQKIANTIDAALYEAVKARARTEGCKVNELTEDALRAYLQTARKYSSAVRETRGVCRVSSDVVNRVLQEDYCDTE